MLYIILMHISHFMFFANDLFLAVYILYMFYTMEMMLDKKQIAIFLFEFTVGLKAVETTCNINNPFGLGTANER